MASLKKGLKNKSDTEKIEKEVAEVREISEEKNLTKAESEAIIKKQEEDESKGADTERLRRATALVSGKFNLDSTFSVSKFDDKGKVVNLTLENKDFVVSVSVKDSDKHGLAVVD